MTHSSRGSRCVTHSPCWQKLFNFRTSHGASANAGTVMTFDFGLSPPINGRFTVTRCFDHSRLAGRPITSYHPFCEAAIG